MANKPFGALGVPQDLAQLERFRKIDPAKIIVVDTETTGLDPKKDEVLSVSIVDAEGNTLFDSLVRPARRKRWPEAQKIHGIAWKDVKDCEELLDLGDEIDAIFHSALLIVGYNVEFDIDMLRAGGLRLSNRSMFDVMREFAPVNGQWNSYRHDWKWSKLTDCAKHYGVPEFEAHGSLADAKATAACFSALIRDPAYEALIAEYELERKTAERKREAEKKVAAEKARSDKRSTWANVIGCILGVIVFFVTASFDTLWIGIAIVAGLITWVSVNFLYTILS